LIAGSLLFDHVHDELYLRLGCGAGGLLGHQTSELYR
jgi:hypothetical protein